YGFEIDENEIDHVRFKLGAKPLRQPENRRDNLKIRIDRRNHSQSADEDVRMFTHVNRPISLGPLEIKNRIVRTAHGTNFGLNDGHIEYHLARARGGVALTVLEVGS